MANSDVTTLALVCTLSAAINATHAVQTKADPVPRLVASGMAFVGLSVTGALLNRYDFVIALAWVFLIASLVKRGPDFIRTATTVPGRKA